MPPTVSRWSCCSAGEAGVGKTRLAEQLAAAAEEQGCGCCAAVACLHSFSLCPPLRFEMMPV
jgi:hypothetical protein